MGRPRGRIALFSFQGFILRYVSTAEAAALLGDPASGFSVYDTQYGPRITKSSYQSARENSPTSITVTDIKMFVGLYGPPKPEEKRRDGYIDPIESATDKIRAWKTVPSAMDEVTVSYSPWFPPLPSHERVQETLRRLRSKQDVNSHGKLKKKNKSRQVQPSAETCQPVTQEAGICCP